MFMRITAVKQGTTANRNKHRGPHRQRWQIIELDGRVVEPLRVTAVERANRHGVRNGVKVKWSSGRSVGRSARHREFGPLSHAHMPVTRTHIITFGPSGRPGNGLARSDQTGSQSTRCPPPISISSVECPSQVIPSSPEASASANVAAVGRTTGMSRGTSTCNTERKSPIF